MDDSKTSVSFSLKFTSNLHVGFKLTTQNLELRLLEGEKVLDTHMVASAAGLRHTLDLWSKPDLPRFFHLKAFGSQLFYVTSELGLKCVVASKGLDFSTPTLRKLKQEIRPLTPFEEAVLDAIGESTFHHIVSHSLFTRFCSLAIGNDHQTVSVETRPGEAGVFKEAFARCAASSPSTAVFVA